MKKTLRLFAPTLAILMLVVYLSSCSLISILKGVSDGSNNKDTDITDVTQSTDAETFAEDTTTATIKPEDSSNDTAEMPEPEITTPVLIENIEDYVLVRPDMASTEVKNAVMNLRETIADTTGADLDLSTDYGPKSKYEILIGPLIREDIKTVTEGLRSKDYIIKFDGSKIIIVGGCDDSLITAINKFKELFIVEGKVFAPAGNGFSYSHDYILESISIKGTPLSEYKIYSVNELCAEKLSVNISEKFSGQVVEVAKKMSNNDGPYIVLKPTSLNYTHYDVEFDGNDLIVSGSYKSCYEFFDYFAKQGEKTVNIKNNFSGDIDRPDLYTKDELMYVLETVYDEDGRLIIGQESLGGTEPYAKSINLFYEGTGEYPGIVGVDLSWAGLRLYDEYGSSSATAELTSQTFCEMVEYAETGGIFTVGSHFYNPNREGIAHFEEGSDQCRGYLGKETAFKQVITPGTKYNKNFKEELDVCIEFLKACDDIGLSLIWRPFHEMNTNWFWWSLQQKHPSGSYTIDSTSYVNLWKYLYNQLDAAGLDNLIWFYCPDVSWIDNMKAYPGDDYCDIVGSDWYTRGKLELWYYNSAWGDPSATEEQGFKTYPLKNLMSTGKPVAIGEMGVGPAYEGNSPARNNSGMGYVEDLTEIFNNGGKLAYAMTWTVDHSFLKLGKGKEAMATGMFIDRDELFNKYFPAARAALGN